jgi:hypothetical protein
MYDARISYRYMNEYIYIYTNYYVIVVIIVIYIYDAYRTDSGMITVECSIIFHTL